MRLEGEEPGEQPVSASGVRKTRCDGERNRVARDFSVSRFSQSSPLDDFARRTSENRALNKSLRRSCGDFERSKCSLFGIASDFFALGAGRNSQSSRGDAKTRREEKVFRKILSRDLHSGLINSQCECSHLCRKL